MLFPPACRAADNTPALTKLASRAYSDGLRVAGVGGARETRPSISFVSHPLSLSLPLSLSHSRSLTHTATDLLSHTPLAPEAATAPE